MKTYVIRQLRYGGFCLVGRGDETDKATVKYGLFSFEKQDFGKLRLRGWRRSPGFMIDNRAMCKIK